MNITKLLPALEIGKNEIELNFFHGNTEELTLTGTIEVKDNREYYHETGTKIYLDDDIEIDFSLSLCDENGKFYDIEIDENELVINN